MKLKTLLLFASLTSFGFLTACITPDAGIAKEQQCSNLRHEIWKVQSNPQMLKTHIATSQYKNMRMEYGNLDCRDLSDYFKSER